MIHVLIEENYMETNRFHELFEGISYVAKKKHLDVVLYKTIDEIPKHCRVAILLGASLKWSATHIQRLCERGVHPLIFAMEQSSAPYAYSSITPDYTRAIYGLTKYLLSQDNAATALVGYNEDSQPDRLKYAGFCQAVQEFGAPYTVFENRGDVLACLDNFAQNCQDVKNIVCCNDNIAAMLYVKYPQLLQDRKLCSSSGLKLSEFFDNPYLVCRTDFYKAGEQLAELYAFLCKGKEILPTVMTLAVDFYIGAEQITLPFTPSGTQSSEKEIDFYGDKSLKQMEKLDKMLSECDETDIQILKGIVDNQTYEDISEENFVAVNTVKYRIKKMLSTADVSNKKELLERLEEYCIKFKK